MTEQEIRNRMEEAFKEDRERLFKVTDGMKVQPKYKDKLVEIETICQEWRDKPSTENFPNFTHPMSLPDWFPNVNFASNWKKDKYIQDMLQKTDIDI